MTRRLEGKVALITGGGGGIGSAMALRFSAEGAAVVVNDLSARNAQAIVGEIKEHGGKALAHVADVSLAGDVERMIAKASEAFGGLDILVNNAFAKFDDSGRRSRATDSKRG